MSRSDSAASHLALPGQEILDSGLVALAEGRETVEALCLAIGAPRLRELGVELPADLPPCPEDRLYRLLAEQDSDAAHSRYNALIRRLVSLERALACASPPTPSASPS